MTTSTIKKRIFIVEYGYKLFNEGGLPNINISKIAKAGHFSIMSVYYIFNTKEALISDILTIALGSFKAQLAYKSIHSIADLNLRLLSAFKEVPGLIHEVIYNNADVIKHLTKIITPLISDSIHTNIQIDLFLICSAMALTEKIDLKISATKMLQTIDKLNENLEHLYSNKD